MTVLIVEDSLTARMELEEAFEAAGFAATSCADLAAARRALGRARFSLVVLDVLPEGDGLELLAELRRTPRTAGTPVVLLATEAEAGEALRGLAVAADAYLGKPYDAAAIAARARELVRQAAEGAGARGGVEVLVVDDSVTVREELRTELEGAGFAVRTAASGEDGLRLAAAHPPAAVVVDGAMPGMDGAAFIRHLRADSALRTTPCILLTASQSVGELGALDAGADAYVRKEEGHEVVLARLQALVRVSSPPSARTPSLLSPKRVVVVSPEDARQRELAERLRGDGHDALGARDAEEALELLARARVDAVVLDGGGKLEEALAGCARIRSAAAGRDVPLLLVGEGDAQDLLPRALDAGADDYVTSAKGEVLRARVRAQLRRKQFEDENRLRDSYARNAAILETIADAFFAADREWRLVYVNHAFEGLVGRGREVLLGERLWQRADESGLAALEAELRRAAEEGAPRTFEAPFPGERWFEVRAFPHEDGVSAHLRDVTERRRSQEVQAHLLGIVGHDLRTPLTSIRVSASGLVRDPTLGERRLRALERIEAGAVRMTRLINDLLDYSRSRLGHGFPLERVPADMDAICREALEAVRAAHPARTFSYLPAGDGAGEWDPERLQQALVNLLTNAVRHGAPDSEVTLAWRAEPDRTVVSVHNHGAPIDPALFGHLFEPFKRGAPRGAPAGAGWGGVGLGLYIVKQIVAAHEGSVGVRSEARAGTTFELVLPRRGAGATA